MKQEIKLTFQILTRHLIIGALVTVLIFWIINEIPYSDYLLARLHIWLTIPFGLTLATWLTSKLAYRQVVEQKRNVYIIAFGFIFFIWTIAFLSTALSEGVMESIKNRQFEILDALQGYAIYRLWFYWGAGIIHGLTGGLFLSIDLKKLKE